MLCYAAKFRPIISNPRWIATRDVIQFVIAAIAEIRITLAALAALAIFFTLFVHHTLCAGWTMFMPCWQLWGKARTSWGMCWAGRGDSNVYHNVRRNPYIWLDMVVLRWLPDAENTVLYPIVYLTMLNLKQYLVVDGSHGAQYFKYLTIWLL